MPITSKTARALFAGVPHLLAVAPAVVMMVLWWDRLPESLATQFGVDGAVSDQTSRTGLLVGTLVLGIVLAVALGVPFGLASTRPTRGMPLQWFAAVSWATAGLIAPLLLTMVLVNIDVTEPSTAEMPISALSYGLGGAILAGVLGFFLAPAGSTPDSELKPAQLEFGPTEQVSWQKNASTSWLALVGAGLLIPGVISGWTAYWGVGLIVALSGLVLLLFARVLVRADQNGLTVSFGMANWPRLRIPLEDISAADAEETSPAQYGGFGYRVVPGGSAVILRQGPTLIVTRTSGRWFAVTVPDPETAAGVLNGLLARKG